MDRPKIATASPIASIKHQDKRTNIPTEELRDFMTKEESAPATLFYPRDPSLDPQLVWKGKDEQDQTDLAVPAVPIYIQEKIHPQAIIDQVRAEAKTDNPKQASLFADFNGINFEELIDFYHHEQNWSNRMILGDSLLVMTSLAEKEGLKGKVQMLYLDPPYGIRFGSNWQISTRKREVKDGKLEDLTRQPEQIKAFRDTWEFGIHSYLAYLRDRFTVARDLLTDSGSIFVQIGNENVHLARSLLDEVFGTENFIANIVFTKTITQTTELLPSVFDHLLWYSKQRNSTKYRQLFTLKIAGEAGATRYEYVELPDGTRRRLLPTELESPEQLPSGSRIFTTGDLTSQEYRPDTSVPFTFRRQAYIPGANRHWNISLAGMAQLEKADRIVVEGRNLRVVRFLDDNPAFPIAGLWTDTMGIQSRTDPRIYVVQTATKIIERCMLMTTDPGDLVLDPTCGSGTTAYVAEQWGRRWITIDTSRVALALARTRLMAAKYPYYLLADSHEGYLKEIEATGQVPPSTLPKTENNIKKGFVYKRVPHITLKSIAQNPEIDGIYAAWQEKLEPLRTQLNHLLGQSWEEWQIPRESGASWGEDARQTHKDWWELRRKRQQEIDAAIAHQADPEFLYDQPYEDSRRIRVTGPFTVESISPHRMLSTNQERPAAEEESQQQDSTGQFEITIIGHLKKAGVQNTKKEERLKFDRLEPYAGTWLNAAGEYTEADGTARRVAVCIGPEHGTVDPELIKEAAKEAVQGVGFDLLIVCGFAFDPYVSEEVKRYGKLVVLTARMNPDLAMGDELLKNTGAGNLFMVFGEPDILVEKQPDGKVAVTILGVDVYDPTTGQIRNSSTDDIACWFIDTDYNEESFFVRHAYFTGGDEPYERLKRALRAEIDEAAWSAIYSTRSVPFDPPKTGKIAVKAINHYGDEVLRVYNM